MFNAMLMRSRNKKGFTLMEMLIVVAIIAILVAVSFPVFTAQLNKAKLATDQANVRAAKAVAVATYLTNNAEITDDYYDALGGTILGATEAKTSIKVGYGQDSTGSSANVVGPTGAMGVPTTTSILKVSVDDKGVFTATWVPVNTIAP